jgi:hypothetical protein
MAVGACAGSNESGPKNGNGVDDVRMACDLRTAWVRSGNSCSLCEAATVEPRCDCSALVDSSAACIDQGNAAKAACPQSVTDCVDNCSRTDCACIEQCYASDAKCKSAAAARDGCVTATCASHCK